jgi:hypothetical protein
MSDQTALFLNLYEEGALWAVIYYSKILPNKKTQLLYSNLPLCRVNKPTPVEVVDL